MKAYAMLMSSGFLPTPMKLLVFVILVFLLFGLIAKFPALGYKSIESDCPPGENCAEYHFIRFFFELLVLYSIACMVVNLFRRFNGE